MKIIVGLEEAEDITNNNSGIFRRSRYWRTRSFQPSIKIATLLQRMMDEFHVTPEQVADSVAIKRQDVKGNYGVLIEYPCADTHGSGCESGIHIWGSQLKHYHVACFRGEDVNEITAKLKKWFEPVGRIQPNTASVVLPEIGDLSEKIGLNDWIKEDSQT